MTGRYEQAIIALNGLQTNHAILDKVIKERQKNVHLNIPLTKNFLEISGMSLNELDKLKVIHVSGTKGKGSTCAFCESILRKRGYKTGLYTSPHLFSVTERIRINGQPIDKEKFADYFWEVYNTSKKNSCPEFRFPEQAPYFKFLTILAFNIFLKEKVDVAIIEVGIGGTYDCTNIIRNPIACGITTLDIDHTAILGNTVEEIAWHKAGIMKSGSIAFTDGNIPEGALRVLKKVSEENECELYKVPELTNYDWGNYPPLAIGLYGAIHNRNASVALQLARVFFEQEDRHISSSKTKSILQAKSEDLKSVLRTANTFKLDKEEALGLRLCRWPGRAHIINKRPNLSFFLDGAHTSLSIQACRAWFEHVSKLQQETIRPIRTLKILIFNTTKDRQPKQLLSHFATFPFDKVIFSTNLTKLQSHKNSDNTNYTTSTTGQSKRCEEHKMAWEGLQNERLINNDYFRSENPELNDNEPNQHSIVPCYTAETINDAIDFATNTSADKVSKEDTLVQILVTGSIHLVGGVLQIVDPDIFDRTEDEECLRISEEYKKLSAGLEFIGEYTL